MINGFFKLIWEPQISEEKSTWGKKYTNTKKTLRNVETSHEPAFQKIFEIKNKEFLRTQTSQSK